MALTGNDNLCTFLLEQADGRVTRALGKEDATSDTEELSCTRSGKSGIPSGSNYEVHGGTVLLLASLSKQGDASVFERVRRLKILCGVIVSETLLQ